MSNNIEYSHRSQFYLLFVTCLIGIILASCSGMQVEITATPGMSANFQTIGQGNALTTRTAGPGDEPALIVLTNTDQLKLVIDWLDPTTSEKISNTNFDENWVAVAFSGKAGSSGYHITITQVNKLAGEIHLIVKIEGPAPDQAVSTIITHPFHAISVDSTEIPLETGTVVKLIDMEGNILDQITIP